MIFDKGGGNPDWGADEIGWVAVIKDLSRTGEARRNLAWTAKIGKKAVGCDVGGVQTGEMD